MKFTPLFCKLVFLLLLSALIPGASAQNQTLAVKTTADVLQFINSLDPIQKKAACFTFNDSLRLDWNYVPRSRKGLTLKNMNPEQQTKALQMVKSVLSTGGYQKTKEIIALENVLRVIENKPPDDTYRDPENYSFLISGTPGSKDPWGWRIEGHHISLHFTIVNNKITFTPGFLGSNPGKILADVPQKGKRVLKEEQDVAFQLLHSFSSDQQRQVILSEKAPWEILSSNKRSDLVRLAPEGIAMKDMTPAQKKLFLQLITVYLDRYHVTLKDQQMNKLKEAGLDGIHFAWMGNMNPEIKEGAGYYYRIQGSSVLIEFDNTQNNGNHIHTVVRDLTNDFGEDLLRAHYKTMHTNH